MNCIYIYSIIKMFFLEDPQCLFLYTFGAKKGVNDESISRTADDSLKLTD